MAKLKDLVNVNINRDVITIQGVEIPVVFTMKSFPYIEEAYGKGYVKFEKDLNEMLTSQNVILGQKEIKLMSSLIYAMVRSGGTECTPEELLSSIPLGDLPNVFTAVLAVFNNQIFQGSDLEKLDSASQKGKKKRK